MRIVYLGIFIWVFLVSSQAQSPNFELYADNAMPNQSAANYGKYLVLVAERLEKIMLYDLEEKRPVYTLNLSKSDIVDNPTTSHCNQCCFGREKYSKKDDFPLLYVSQRAPRKSDGAYLDVLRIVTYKSEKKKIDSFKVQRVQRIHFPVMSDVNCMGNPNAVIDINRNILYTYSRNNNSKVSNYLKAVVSSYKLPLLFKMGIIQENVFLTDADLLNQFYYDFSLLNAQGGFYRKGTIYFAQGYPSKKPELNYVYFRGLDSKKTSERVKLDMLKDGFRDEPEGCWFWKGQVWVSTDSGRIYRLSGKNYVIK